MKNVLKSKTTWKVTGVLAAVIVSYSIGSSGATTTINKEKVTYDYLVKKVDEKENELAYTQRTVKKDIAAEEKKLSDKKTEVTEALALLGKKQELNAEIEKAGKDADVKKGEITKLDTDINAKKSELEKLNEGVKAKKEEPLSLNAGEYIVGKDVPPGRYKATAVGRGTNFFVYNSSGRAQVNTILGDSSVGKGDYVFFCDSGNVIKTHGPVKLIPVE
jgi:hypothetical protein